MVATVATVAYLGLEARAVEVQVQLSAGLPAFVIVGLPDKAVAESRERVRAALAPTGTLRVGVYPGSPTSMVRDEKTGRTAGVALDLGQALGQRLRIQILARRGRRIFIPQGGQGGLVVKLGGAGDAGYGLCRGLHHQAVHRDVADATA